MIRRLALIVETDVEDLVEQPADVAASRLVGLDAVSAAWLNDDRGAGVDAETTVQMVVLRDFVGDPGPFDFTIVVDVRHPEPIRDGFDVASDLMSVAIVTNLVTRPGTAQVVREAGERLVEALRAAAGGSLTEVAVMGPGDDAQRVVSTSRQRAEHGDEDPTGAPIELP